MIALRVLAFGAGLWVVVVTLTSSLRTTVLPRAVPERITRRVFRTVRWLFGLRIGKDAPYLKRDRIMAYYGPVALLALLVTWLFGIGSGFFLLYWAVGVPDVQHAFYLSGSTVFTLGFERPPTVASGLRVGTPAVTMRGFTEDDLREVGSIITDALTPEPDLDGLRARADALCERHPLYPGFRGYTTYETE